MFGVPTARVFKMDATNMVTTSKAQYAMLFVS